MQAVCCEQGAAFGCWYDLPIERVHRVELLGSRDVPFCAGVKDIITHLQVSQSAAHTCHEQVISSDDCA